MPFNNDKSLIYPSFTFPTRETRLALEISLWQGGTNTHEHEYERLAFCICIRTVTQGRMSPLNKPVGSTPSAYQMWLWLS